MHDVKSHLLKLPFWEHLDPDQKECLSNSAVVLHYQKGTVIFGSESACLGMVLLRAGDIRTYLLSEEGREITLFRLTQGELCVLSASCVIRQITFDTQMVAESDCDLLVIHSAMFHQMVQENIHVRCFLYELATERFSSVMWTMQQILFAKMDQRLSRFLLSEYDRTGKLEVPMTHEQIAIRINSAREVVARMLKRFSADGLVQSKRGSVLLKDIDGLRNI